MRKTGAPPSSLATLRPPTPLRGYLRVTRACLAAGWLIVAGCAGAGPAAVPAAGTTPQRAEMQFPSPGTQWMSRSTDEAGWNWLTVGRALDESSYQGRPVFRVSDGLQTLVYDRTTRNWIATLRLDKERFSASPEGGEFSWPLEVGKRWVATFTYRDHQRGRQFNPTWHWEVAALEDVAVPAGTFRAFRLEGKTPVRSRVLWYAPDLRLVVKQVEQRGPRDYLGAGRVVAELVDYAPPGSDPWYAFGYEASHDAVQRGEGRQAMAFYERAADRLLGRGLTLEAAEAQQAYVSVARFLGAYQETIKTGLGALERLASHPASEVLLMRTVNIRFTLGTAYNNIGARPEARRQYEEGLELAQKLGDPQRRLFWTGLFNRGLAQVATAQGDIARAIRDGQASVRALDAYLAALPTDSPFDQSRRDGRRQLAWGLSTVANAQRRQGNLAAAEPLFARALEIARDLRFQELELSASLGLASTTFARDDFDGALRRYEASRTLAARLGNPAMLMLAHNGVGWSQFRSGRYEQALEAFRQSVSLVEGVRASLQDAALRSGYLEDKQLMYQGAVRSAARLGRPDEAFTLAERARARAFLDLLGTNTLLSKGKTRALVAEEVRLRAQLSEAKALVSDELAEPDEIAVAQQRMQAAEQAYRTFLERVRRENVEQASLMTVEPVTLAAVQGLLPEGTTLVEYLVSDQETLAWVVDRSRVELVPLRIRRAELVSEVRAFRQGIESRAALPDAVARAEALHRRLFAPLRRHIRTDRLLLVPHDVLHYLPFGALRSPAGRWLVEDYAIATLPSASVLKYLASKGEAAANGVMAIGNPDVGPALDLRYAEREARGVGERYPGARVLVRDAATEAQAKSLGGEMGLIHFATHGELNEQDPLGSALLLVPGAGEDGRLEVREIFGLDLKARLVVLSACETGLGQLSTGDELVGLQRAFLYAGTPAVVTTLWKVDDRASYLLMRAFYERLATEDATLALRDAQRATMPDYPHPFYWAAFGLTGVPR